MKFVKIKTKQYFKNSLIIRLTQSAPLKLSIRKNQKIMYRKKSHIHFVGIGGIGMSGIAKILTYQGHTISGCDVDLDQQSIRELIKLGCTISSEHNSKLCNDNSIDILVYSTMIQPNSPEILYAQQRGIPTIPRALMLAELMRTKHGIAIAGSHGKTTTTSMISHILIEAGLNPTVIIGGHLKNINTNAQFGDGDFLVAEADESDRSFLHLYPTIALVTNIDLEHLETYHDIDDIKSTFKNFLENVPFYGTAVVCIDDYYVRSLMPITHIKAIKYGMGEHAARYQTDIYANNIILEATHSTFTVWQKDKEAPLGTVHISMPGSHNILNALGAITISLDLNIPFITVAKALKTFTGVKRRFSYNGLYKDAEIFDDYGHHPNEIIHTLAVARKRSKNALRVVFQPHRFTRTDKLWHSFIEIFLRSNIDELIITDIHAAFEAPIPTITSARLVQEIKNHNPSFSVTYIPFDDSYERIINHLNQVTQKDDLILLQGAGKINKLIEKMLNKA
jgi:UDP-N-acetylmuramate--alanine ligase